MGAKSISASLATLCANQSVRVIVDERQLKVAVGETTSALFYSKSYGKSLWQAGVKEIEIPQGMNPKEIRATLNALTDRKLCPAREKLEKSRFEFEGVERLGLPISWKGTAEQIVSVRAPQNYAAHDRARAGFKYILAGLGGVAGAALTYLYAEEITFHVRDQHWRDNVSRSALAAIGAGSSALLGGFGLGSMWGLVWSAYESLRLPGDYLLLRKGENSVKPLSEKQIERLDIVLQRARGREFAAQYLRSLNSDRRNKLVDFLKGESSLWMNQFFREEISQAREADRLAEAAQRKLVQEERRRTQIDSIVGLLPAEAQGIARAKLMEVSIDTVDVFELLALRSLHPSTREVLLGEYITGSDRGLQPLVLRVMEQGAVSPKDVAYLLDLYLPRSIPAQSESGHMDVTTYTPPGFRTGGGDCGDSMVRDAMSSTSETWVVDSPATPAAFSEGDYQLATHLVAKHTKAAQRQIVAELMKINSALAKEVVARMLQRDGVDLLADEPSADSYDDSGRELTADELMRLQNEGAFPDYGPPYKKSHFHS